MSAFVCPKLVRSRGKKLPLCVLPLARGSSCSRFLSLAVPLARGSSRSRFLFILVDGQRPLGFLLPPASFPWTSSLVFSSQSSSTASKRAGLLFIVHIVVDGRHPPVFLRRHPLRRPASTGLASSASSPTAGVHRSCFVDIVVVGQRPLGFVYRRHPFSDGRRPPVFLRRHRRRRPASAGLSLTSVRSLGLLPALSRWTS